MVKSEELLKEEELTLRNPQVDFSACVNLAVQTGYKSIAQQVEDFRRAGRAIQVARADASYPEMAGLPAYPDPIETELLRREVDADLLIARRQLMADQEAAQKAAEERAGKNAEELERIKAAEQAVQRQQEPPSKA